MVTEVDARRAIYDRMDANWDTTLAVFHKEGQGRFDPPVRANWVRLSVRHNDSEQESLGPPGSRKYRRIGQIVLQLFAPVDDGLEPLDTMVRQGRTIFEGVRFSEIRTFDAVATEIGSDGDYFQTNLDVDFDYEEQK